jgi:dihydrofolate synthase/folylpolyglutamate synthase
VTRELNQSDSLDEWLGFIDQITIDEIELGLDRVRQAYKNLNIKQSFPIVMVGGTNGKGSTCAFLESIFHSASYKVACYSSPHFFKFNERVRVNKATCSDKVIVNALFRVNEARKNIPLTYFEMTTLAAMLIFVESDIDIAIMEVGLGGRLDAVNIFDPEVSLITSVSIDHQEFLGGSVEKIFKEKVGIFRDNKNAILNFGNQEAFIKKFKDASKALDGSKIDFYGQTKIFLNLPLPKLFGKTQLQNLSGALRVVELIDKKYPITQSSLKKGIKQTDIIGRLHCINKNPFIILDVAHNEESAESLNQFFIKQKLKGKVRCVFSLLKGKNIMDITEPFIGYVDEWYISEIDSPRALEAKEIISSLQKQRKDVTYHSFKNTEKAFSAAYKNSDDNDNIIAFGSFFIVSEILKDNSICQIQKTQ